MISVAGSITISVTVVTVSSCTIVSASVTAETSSCTGGANSSSSSTSTLTDAATGKRTSSNFAVSSVLFSFRQTLADFLFILLIVASFHSPLNRTSTSSPVLQSSTFLVLVEHGTISTASSVDDEVAITIFSSSETVGSASVTDSVITVGISVTSTSVVVSTGSIACSSTLAIDSSTTASETVCSTVHSSRFGCSISFS